MISRKYIFLRKSNINSQIINKQLFKKTHEVVLNTFIQAGINYSVGGRTALVGGQ